jgi:hypothetical protein
VTPEAVGVITDRRLETVVTIDTMLEKDFKARLRFREASGRALEASSKDDNVSCGSLDSSCVKK